MNKLLIFLIFLMTLVASSSAQDTTGQGGKYIMIPKELLTQDQIKQIEKLQNAEIVTQDLENYRKWAGMGKEIGVAINDGLKAVSDQTAQFAETTPGKLSMILITWKVLGDDVVGLTRAVTGIVVGVPMLIGFVSVWLWIYRRTTTKRRLLESQEGNKKNYKYEDTWYTECAREATTGNMNASELFQLFWWVSFCIGIIWITAGVIF